MFENYSMVFFVVRDLHNTSDIAPAHVVMDDTWGDLGEAEKREAGKPALTFSATFYSGRTMML